MRHLIPLLMAVVFTFASAATVAAAPGATNVTFSGASTTRVKGQVALTATLKGPDGKPLSERSVDFYELVTLFGERQSYLGSATTDSSGVATLVYEAAQTGRQTITVSFPGTDDFAASQASAPIDVAEAGTPFEPEPQPLALVSRWLPVGLGAMVFATWVVLLGVFLSAVLGIRATAPAASTSLQEVATNEALSQQANS